MPNPARSAAWILAWLTLPVVQAFSAPFDDDPDSLAPGVVVRTRSGGVEVGRIVHDLSWELDAADLAVSGPLWFEATGSIQIQTPGRHTFSLESFGLDVTLTVDGMEAARRSGGGSDAPPVELRPGFVPFRLEARGVQPERTGKDVRRFLFVQWNGPGFESERLPARLLYHDRTTEPPPDRVEEGRRLTDRLGCGNCHDGLTRHRELGPDLPASVRGVNPGWLARWLQDPISVRPKSRMPAFGRGLNEVDASDLVAYLAKLAASEKPPSAEVKMALNVASADKGRLLFRSVGCLGCHARGETTDGGLPTAPDLANVGRSRSREALAAYLEHPRGNKSLSVHRPDMKLTADESAHLVAYLLEGEMPVGPPVHVQRGDAERGQKLSARFRCSSCHAMKGQSPEPPLTRRDELRPEAGCLADEPAADRPDVPRYALNKEERAALRAFVGSTPGPYRPDPTVTRAEDSIRRRNCFGCHARDGRGGSELAGRLAPLLGDDPLLGGLKGTLTPPNLTAVGDKLRPEYLATAVRGAAPTARPWLSVRMPVYTFEVGEAEALASTFVTADHVAKTPSVSKPQTTRPLKPETRELAGRLIGQTGFGCVSCHVLDGRIPPGGEPETLGPDLALAHRRMTERYFRRWISDPQRVIPGTPMPQFLKPISGAPGTLDEQLGAIWELLGSGSLAEVAASGTREILKGDGDRALVVRDMVLVPSLPDTPYTPRGIAVGLKNGASLLFDSDRIGWLACWDGGFLSRTKSGRLWEWHPEGRVLWTAAARVPPVVFIGEDGSVVRPTEQRERFGSFRSMEFVGDGVRLQYDLAVAGKAVTVTEDVKPDSNQGWIRAISLGRAPVGFKNAIVVQIPKAAHETRGGTEFTWKIEDDVVSLRVDGVESASVPMPGDSSSRVFAVRNTTEEAAAASILFTNGARTTP